MLVHEPRKDKIKRKNTKEVGYRVAALLKILILEENLVCMSILHID